MTSIKITPFNVGELKFDLSAIYKLPSDHPYAGKQATLPMRSFHIALPGRSVLGDAAGYDVNHLSDSMRIPGYSPPASLTE
jgi:hypothetical protein